LPPFLRFDLPDNPYDGICHQFVFMVFMSLAHVKTGLALLLAASAYANAMAPRQDIEALRTVAEQFLTTQTAGITGKSEIIIGQVDKRLSLASCQAPQAFLPAGAKAWGKTSVGIRCTAPATWTVYIPAAVHVYSDYIVAASALPQGHVIQAGDIKLTQGDLTKLPAGVLTNTALAVGQTLARALPIGTALRPEAFRTKKVIQQGQTVRIVALGNGFQISNEGRAITNAVSGQVAQAITASGQIVRGIAREGGVIELAQ